MAQRGFSLIEIMVAVGLSMVLAACALALTRGSRPAEVGSALAGFDALMNAADAIAATSANGATIIVEPLNARTRLTLYAGRPNGLSAMSRTAVPALETQAQISEASSGSPPFAIFISGSGHAAIQPHYPDSSSNDRADIPILASEPACPSLGRYDISFRVNGAVQTRSIFCTTSSSGTPEP